MHCERTKSCLLSFCHSVYLCKIRVKMLPFNIFAFFAKHVCKSHSHQGLKKQLRHLDLVNASFTLAKYVIYEV